MLASVAPAWRASRIDPATDIKDGRQSPSARRTGNIGPWLIPMQIGFSLILLLIAALMVSTLTRLLAVDPGFRTSGMTFIRADFSQKQQPIAGSKNTRGRVRGIPRADESARRCNVSLLRHIPPR